VVVDHIEQYLDTGGMQRLDGALELVGAALAQVARFGRQEGERVVAPIIGETAVDRTRSCTMA